MSHSSCMCNACLLLCDRRYGYPIDFFIIYVVGGFIRPDSLRARFIEPLHLNLWVLYYILNIYTLNAVRYSLESRKFWQRSYNILILIKLFFKIFEGGRFNAQIWAWGYKTKFIITPPEIWGSFLSYLILISKNYLRKSYIFCKLRKNY